TGRFREFSASSGYNTLAIPKEGMDFFAETLKNAPATIYPDDLEQFLSLFTRENVLAEIGRSVIFSMSYRLVLDGKPHYVRLKAAIVQEKAGARLIVGIIDVDNQVRQEEEYRKRLAQAQNEASIDALTGVKNRHAYLRMEEQMDEQIALRRQREFAISILDVNDLKKVNDVEGHQAGDQLLRRACKVICDIFKHSPVFRVGGDEFAVISQGEDFDHIDELAGRMSDHNTRAIATGGVVIACGVAKFKNDDCLATVFERADQQMYENKSLLKAAAAGKVKLRLRGE
ncbi:MAG: GGDEF domain-containing protein, partial [bacterium]